MHGLGNDFVEFDTITGLLELSPRQLRFIADRHFGIGCDQILQDEPLREPGTSFYNRIFNADGNEVEQCGNGARCVVRYVRDKRLTTKTEIRVGTLSGVIAPRLQPDGQVADDMGIPIFSPSEIPFDAPKQALTYTLEVDGETIEINALSVGNPHAVQVVEDIDAAPVVCLMRTSPSRRVAGTSVYHGQGKAGR